MGYGSGWWRVSATALIALTALTSFAWPDPTQARLLVPTPILRVHPRTDDPFDVFSLAYGKTHFSLFTRSVPAAGQRGLSHQADTVTVRGLRFVYSTPAYISRARVVRAITIT